MFGYELIKSKFISVLDINQVIMENTKSIYYYQQYKKKINQVFDRGLAGITVRCYVMTFVHWFAKLYMHVVSCLIGKFFCMNLDVRTFAEKETTEFEYISF